MNIFDREHMRELYEIHKEDGMTRTDGYAECFTWHGVSVSFISNYPSDVICPDEVHVEIDGKPAEKYFGIKVEFDDFLYSAMDEAERIFWETPEYVEKAEHMFLGTYKEE